MMKLQCEVAKNHHRMVFLQHRSVLGVLFVLEHRPWCSIGALGCPNAWCSEDTKTVSVGHPCFNSVNLCDPVSQIYAILCHNICDRVPNIDDVTNLCDPVSQYMRPCFPNLCDVTNICDLVSQIYSMLHASMRYWFTNIFDVTSVYAILFHKYAILFHKYVRSIKDIDSPYRRYLELIFATFRVPYSSTGSCNVPSNLLWIRMLHYTYTNYVTSPFQQKILQQVNTLTNAPNLTTETKKKRNCRDVNEYSLQGTLVS